MLNEVSKPYRMAQCDKELEKLFPNKVNNISELIKKIEVK
jgi:hypothetical protein